MADGNLRALLRECLPQIDFQSVETWGTGRGVPDVNFCAHGVEGWVELKRTTSWRVDFSREQVAWLERRVRHGGRVFVLVRRQVPAGPRKGAAADELYLLRAAAARQLIQGLRLDAVPRLGLWEGGPSSWDWKSVGAFLLNPLL